MVIGYKHTRWYFLIAIIITGSSGLLTTVSRESISSFSPNVHNEEQQAFSSSLSSETVTEKSNNLTGVSKQVDESLPKENQKEQLLRDPLIEEMNLTNPINFSQYDGPSEYVGPASIADLKSYTIEGKLIDPEQVIDINELSILNDTGTDEELSTNQSFKVATYYHPDSNELLIKYISSHTVADPPSDLRIFKYIGGERIVSIPGRCNLDPSNVQIQTAANPNWLTDTGASCPNSEPAVASNGTTALLAGNHFVTQSTNAGLDWSASGLDYNQGNDNNQGRFVHSRLGGDNNCCDNDVIYSSQIDKFLWFRQGNDGRFSIGISPDLTSWNYINIEANYFHRDINIDTILRNSGLTSPRGVCNGESTRECSINFWWDYPQLALSSTYLYLSTDLILGCGQGVTNPSCMPSTTDPHPNYNYGAVVFRINLNDLNSNNPGNIINMQYLQQSQHQYYDPNSSFLTLSQEARNTMYWATLIPTSDRQMKICKWDDDLSATPTCNTQDVGQYYQGRISCPASNDRRDWCWSNANREMAGWVYGDVVGFMWNVGADPAGPYTKPWLKAAVFNSNNLQYIQSESERYSLASPNEWIQLAFVSPNERGLGLLAWYGDSGSPSGVLAAISDNYSPHDPSRNAWDVFKWLRPAYSGQTHDNLPSSMQRFGDYLRVRPYAGSSNLWEGSGYYLTGDDINPAVKIFYVVFGRASDEAQYRSLSNRAIVTGSPIFQVITPVPHEAEGDPSLKYRYNVNNGRLVISVTFNRPVNPASVTVGTTLMLDTKVANSILGMTSEVGTVTYADGGRTLIFTTDRNNLAEILCGASSFQMKLVGVRDSTGQFLDGNYDFRPGGTYVFNYSPPPC